MYLKDYFGMSEDCKEYILTYKVNVQFWFYPFDYLRNPLLSSKALQFAFIFVLLSLEVL